MKRSLLVRSLHNHERSVPEIAIVEERDEKYDRKQCQKLETELADKRSLVIF